MFQSKHRRQSLVTAIGGALLMLLSSASGLIAQNATEIVRQADQKQRGKSSEATLTIRIVRPSYSREMMMHTWSKGSDLALVLVTAPAREKGTVFLKRKREVWNWLPSIERTVKLPPSMMSESWMGTDFTNDDLVREASVVDDYTHTLLGEASIEGESCYKVQLIPKKEAAVVWGKVILWIEKKELLILRAEYYDEDGSLVNTLSGSDVKKIGGRMVVTRLEMVPADKPGNKTILSYTDLKFDLPLKDELFRTESMQTVK
ncbi:MAG: outer membrane lipoprotein-sorting protein [Bacteroidetes bacterium]|nr:outer membrane lipoprotein-sorting protein [Bacteroidota bacterium]